MKPVALISVLVCLLSAGAAWAVDVPSTYGDAMRWYKRAAEGGSANAQFFLGRMYETGQSRKKDPVAAAGWDPKTAAQGHRPAQNPPVPGQPARTRRWQSYADAASWLEKAASQGLREAQYDLGYLYDRGFGVERSPRIAAGWYRKAAEQGLGPAQYNLGVLLAGDSMAGGGGGGVVEGAVWVARGGGGRGGAAARGGGPRGRRNEKAGGGVGHGG